MGRRPRHPPQGWQLRVPDALRSIRVTLLSSRVLYWSFAGLLLVFYWSFTGLLLVNFAVFLGAVDWYWSFQVFLVSLPCGCRTATRAVIFRERESSRRWRAGTVAAATGSRRLRVRCGAAEAAWRRQVNGGARQGGEQACGARATAGAAYCKVARCTRGFESAPGKPRQCGGAHGPTNSNAGQHGPYLKRQTRLGKNGMNWATGIEKRVAKSARSPVPHAEGLPKKPAHIRPRAASSEMKHMTHVKEAAKLGKFAKNWTTGIEW